MAQVDQVTGVGPEEVVAPPLRFEFLERAGHGDGIAQGMDHDGVSDGFGVHDLGEGEPQAVGSRLHEDRVGAAALQCGNRAFEFLAEGEPGDRFEQIRQRLHLVPTDGVLWRRGDKHDDDMGVLPSDFPGSLHTVHSCHLNIHEQDVICWEVAFDDVGAILERRGDEGSAILIVVALEIGQHETACRGVVLDHTNADGFHVLSPSL